MANLLDECLPNYGFQNAVIDAVENGGLIKTIPFIQAPFASQMFFKGLVEKSLQKLLPGILSNIFIKNPFKGSNLGAPIGGIPEILGAPKGGRGGR